jgi:PAS domain S-box-containing protein
VNSLCATAHLHSTHIVVMAENKVSHHQDESERPDSENLKNDEDGLRVNQPIEREMLERRTQELLEQREWFQVTLSSIGDAVITTDTQGTVTFLNPVAEAMTGWKREEAVGRTLTNVFQIVNEYTRLPVDNPIEKVLQTGLIVGLANHTALIARDGREVAVEDSAAPIRDAHGKVSGAVMVFHDVTERRRAEEALRDARVRLEAALSAADIGTWTWDVRKDRIVVDSGFARLFSLAADDVAGAGIENYLEVVHPEDRPRFRATLSDALRPDGSAFEIDHRLVRPDGAIRWVTGRGRMLRDEGGSAILVSGAAVDITERKAAEASHAMLAALVESSDDAIISKTLDGVITTWNRAAERMFGYRPEEIVGESILKLIPPELSSEEEGILSRLRRGERIEHYETTRVRKDGTRFEVSLTVSPVKDPNGRIIGASKIARDVTQRKRDEAALRELFASAQREIAMRERAEEALRENDRRKDEFLATLAHELRNPLAPIRQAALISKAPDATDPQKRWAHDVINRQVQNMALLLDDLLDISRVTRGTLELRKRPVELALVVESAIETARPILDARRHHFRRELPPEPVTFVADPLRLAQVLSNLLTNAAKYTDPQGEISLSAQVNGEHVVMSVTDSGIGLAPEALDRVFTMFSQVKAAQDRSEGGLGIGLALSKGLVDLHGGELSASSAGPGLGSTFTLRIPFIRGEGQGATRAADVTSAPAPVIRHRILIADDNRDGAESLAVLLRMQGHEVTVVHDGRNAVAAFSREHPEIALLDIGMPDLDGYAVAREVRMRERGKPAMLVAVTGWGNSDDKARAMAAGFDHHFTKPIDPADLDELLRQPGGLSSGE